MEMIKLSKGQQLYLLRIIIILIYLISAYTLVNFFPSGHVTLQQTTALIAVPSSTSIVKGNTLSVVINASNYQNLYAYQFDLNYNPSVLRFKSLAFYDALGDIASGGEFCIPQEQLIKEPGRIGNIVCTRTISGSASGSSSLAMLNFDTIGFGTSNLTINNSILVSSDLQAIPHIINNGSVS